MAHPSSICVFCGASGRVDTSYRVAAARLGALLGERGIRLVFGGGHVGLMGLMADAALAAGGEVVGVIPRHLMDRELGHDHVTELHVVDSMHSRKQKMFDLADAFAVLPGGIGTLDETFEILTWKQLGMHDKPVVVVDVAGYWRPLHDLIAAVIDAGFASPATGRLFAAVDSVEDVLAALERMPEPTLPADATRL